MTNKDRNFTPEELRKNLALIVGNNNIIFPTRDPQHSSESHSDEITQAALPYLQESRGRKTGVALAIIFPSTTEEVAQVVTACRFYRVPMIAQGGNTGRCLGTITDNPNTVIINLKKLHRIREIDSNNMTVTVEAGCVLEDLQKYVAKAGFFFPLSLGAEGSCCIGGNIATNAGGVNVLRYGNTRELTLGIEAVMSNGTVLNELYGLRKNNTGYDIKNLLIGSEGTLGIITAATFKIFPPEINNEHGFIAVQSIDDAITCLQQAQKDFVGKISTFELIPNIAIQYLEKHSHLRCPIGNQHPWYIWYKIADSNPDTPLYDNNLSLLEKLMEQGIVIDATVSYNETMKKLFWQIRETIVAVQKAENVSIKFDVSVPISALPTLVEKGNAAVAAIDKSIQPYPFGHLGDGNLHYNFSRPKGVSDKEFKTHYQDTINAAIHDIVDGLDGSFSAEHGIGSQKIKHMKTYKDPVALDIMRRIKHSFDPFKLMNPGKVIPEKE